MTRVLFGSLLWVVLLLVSGHASRARADEPLDTIVLRDGTVLRGRVAEMIPGVRVQIVLPTGEPRVVAPSDIASASGPAFPPAAGTAPITPPLLPSQLGAYWRTASADRVRVDVRSVSPEREQDIGIVTVAEVHRWADPIPVCRTPCSLFVPPGRVTLTAAGENLAPLRYNIDVPLTGTEVTFRAPRFGQMAGGLMLASFGMMGTLAGAIAGPVGLSLKKPSPGLTIGGFTTLGVGVAMTVTGIILLHRNKTGIERQRALGLAEGKLIF